MEAPQVAVYCLVHDVSHPVALTNPSWVLNNMLWAESGCYILIMA
jgi:hypothetical protein